MSARSAPSGERLPAPAPPVDAPPAEVAEFIRYCHRRRQVGWPEIYDEMCAVAARREYHGWDHEAFAARGMGFSLFEMPRLAGWVRAVLSPPDEGPEIVSNEVALG